MNFPWLSIINLCLFSYCLASFADQEPRRWAKLLGYTVGMYVGGFVLIMFAFIEMGVCPK